MARRIPARKKCVDGKRLIKRSHQPPAYPQACPSSDRSCRNRKRRRWRREARSAPKSVTGYRGRVRRYHPVRARRRFEPGRQILRRRVGGCNPQASNAEAGESRRPRPPGRMLWRRKSCTACPEIRSLVWINDGIEDIGRRLTAT
jgi:hypothetical protein